jgi:ankyrin repeat protein
MPNHPASAPDLAARIINAETGTTALHQAAGKGTLKDISGVTAEFLATVKDNDGWTPLYVAAWRGHLDQISGVTAEFLASVKHNSGNTPLHEAAQYGHLDQIPGVTAALLANVKDNDGRTPLHLAIETRHLDQIGDLTIKLAEEMGILNATLQPKNIFVFTEDFRRHGTHYNHCPTVSTALLKAASQLPDLIPTERTAIKAALSAAQEGGFVLPSEVLASLL